MSFTILDSRMDPIQYDARSRLTLDLDFDEVTSGEGHEKSTTLRSEDSGIVMMSEIQRDGKTRFPRSPGFHFGLDEESTRNQEQAEEEEVEVRDQDIEVEIACPSPGTNSVSTEGSEFESKRSSVHSSVTTDSADRTQSPGSEETQENEWVMATASEAAQDEKHLEVPRWKEDEQEEKTMRSISPLTLDFVRESPKCTDAHKAVDILKTRYRLADVTVRKSNLTRMTGKSSEFWEYVPVSRLYERPQYEYFGSKQLKGICREIETRNRQLSIILSKILAEDERVRREEEEAMAAAAKRFPATLAVPVLDFFSTSSSPSCASSNLETGPAVLKGDAAKKSDDKDGADGGTGDAQPTKKKRHSMLRRAINGLRKSFSKRPSSRV